MAFKAPSATNVQAAAKNARTSRGKRSNLNHVLTGLPPGAVAVVYDKLHQVFQGGKYITKAIGTYIVDSDGIIRLRNLRDSLYSVQFQSIENLVYNISNLSIGNADLFETIMEGDIPYPVMITGLVNGLDLYSQPYLTVLWILDGHQTDGFYEIWMKSSSETNYHKHTTVYNTQARQFNISPLDYSTLYYITIKTINQEGMSRGYSNTITGMTVANPAASGIFDTIPPAGQIFFY